jgi:hypothetical protein
MRALLDRGDSDGDVKTILRDRPRRSPRRASPRTPWRSSPRSKFVSGRGPEGVVRRRDDLKCSREDKKYRRAAPVGDRGVSAELQDDLTARRETMTRHQEDLIRHRALCARRRVFLAALSEVLVLRGALLKRSQEVLMRHRELLKVHRENKKPLRRQQEEGRTARVGEDVNFPDSAPRLPVFCSDSHSL